MDNDKQTVSIKSCTSAGNSAVQKDKKMWLTGKAWLHIYTVERGAGGAGSAGCLRHSGGFIFIPGGINMWKYLYKAEIIKCIAHNLPRPPEREALEHAMT